MNKTTKLKILQETKKIVKKMGWGSHVIEELKMSNKFKYNELKILFPDGYSDLINLSLTELNEDLINAINLLSSFISFGICFIVRQSK